MLGAIIGDVVGSRFEWRNNRSKTFDFLTYKCFATDDSIMSLAVAKAVLDSKKDRSDLGALTIKWMQTLGKEYPDAGYGGSFSQWLRDKNPQPYNSWGNGSAMRVSACGFAAESLEDAISLSKTVTEVTHNHPEGIKGAEATAVAIYLARSGKSLLDIQQYINEHYYQINFKLDDIRDTYQFNESCQNTVPQALEAFFESTGFEDAIRNAISIGGDSDTLAAITGGIAEAYYGIPADIRTHALTFLKEDLLKILLDFENVYAPKYEVVTEQSSYTIQRNAVSSVSGTTRSEMLSSSFEMVETDKAALEVTAGNTTAQKLFSNLYAAACILHGYVEKASYRTYLIPLLFFKRISDVYDEETEDAIKMYGEEGAKFMGASAHTFIIPDGYHWNDIRNATENVGKVIADTLAKIEQENPKTLDGVFSSFDDAEWANKVILSDELLKNLIEKMSEIKVGNRNYSADVMGDAYEYLLKQFAEDAKKNGGQFYTPRSVVKLLVKILNPEAGETVYDPSCGTGGMLIESIRHMDNQKLAYGKIFGQEINMTTSAIARMNLYLHGAHDFSIRQGDTLRSPKFLKAGKLQTFDNVIANPPFGLSGWGAEAFESDQYGRNFWGTPTDSNADFAWIQHMVASMDPIKGKCVVIMPQGVLFHGGNEGKIREKLIESDKVEAVMTFVGGLFFGAGVSACVLCLNNDKPAEHRGKVLLIDGSTIYTAKRAQNIMSDEDVETAYKLYADYTDVVGYSKVVTLDEIKEHGYTLSVNTYIEKPPAPPMDPAKVREEYFTALENVRECEDRLYALLKEGGYLE